MRPRSPHGPAAARSKVSLRLALLAPVLATLLAACSKDTPPAPSPSTPEVIVQTITVSPLSMTQTLPGRTVAYTVSDVRPQVSGIIQKRLFTEGEEVKAGELLYQIDPASYQAAYDSAKAALAQAEASLQAARPKAQRYANLLKMDAVSRQDADEAQASLRQGEAAVQAAKAALQTARINLDYTSIRAPISGYIGTSSYTPGALVTANQENALTTIRQLDPIYVDVSLSSAQLLSLRKRMNSGKLKSVGESVPVHLLLEDGSRYDQEGSLTFIGTSVGTGTGDVLLRAVVPNTNGLLLPGMYVRAELPMAINEQAILIPQSAVTRNTRGEAAIKLVDADGRLSQRVIRLGDALADQWVVLSGLSSGDQLVTAGGSRLQPGTQVRTQVSGQVAQAAAAASSAP